MKKFGVFRFGSLVLGLCLLLGVWLQPWAQPEARAVMGPLSGFPLVVVDPGHGGEDGGAVSPGGVRESDLNLSIAQKLEQCLALLGCAPALLRQEDLSLHGPEADTLREKKTSDLHRRVELIEELDGAVLVSIHQNSYPQGRYRGAQVFFAPTEGSRELALAVQEALRSGLDPENNRQAAPVPDTLYLMNRIGCPGILVECGFLSNPLDEAQLQEELYQKKLAAVLAVTLLKEI